MTIASEMIVALSSPAAGPSSEDTVSVSSVSWPADTDPLARSHEATRSLLAMTICVSRLFAWVAT